MMLTIKESEQIQYDQFCTTDRVSPQLERKTRAENGKLAPAQEQWYWG
jgi:hypothetical protein